MTINDGDIIRKRGKFRDDRGASGHPLIVIAHDDSYYYTAVCTDANNDSQFTNSLAIDYKACGLYKPTIVICDKLGVVPHYKVKERVGRLVDSEFRTVCEYLFSQQHDLRLFESRREAVLEHGWEVCRRLIAEGRVDFSESAEELIGDDGYYD